MVFKNKILKIMGNIIIILKHVLIQTRTTQIEKSIFLVEKSNLTKFQKTILNSFDTYQDI